jgi:hypothetical protein
LDALLDTVAEMGHTRRAFGRCGFPRRQGRIQTLQQADTGPEDYWRQVKLNLVDKPLAQGWLDDKPGGPFRRADTARQQQLIPGPVDTPKRRDFMPMQQQSEAAESFRR